MLYNIHFGDQICYSIPKTLSLKAIEITSKVIIICIGNNIGTYLPNYYYTQILMYLLNLIITKKKKFKYVGTYLKEFLGTDIK